jgi:hypothetical protein
MARFDDLVKQSKVLEDMVQKQTQINVELKRLTALPTEDLEIIAARDLDLRSKLVDAVVSNKDAALLCELSAAIAEQAKQKGDIEQHKHLIEGLRAEHHSLGTEGRKKSVAIIWQLATYK